MHCERHCTRECLGYYFGVKSLPHQYLKHLMATTKINWVDTGACLYYFDQDLSKGWSGLCLLLLSGTCRFS